MLTRPSSPLIRVSKRASSSCAFGAAPPYSPECKSVLDVRTLISAYASPRRVVYTAGQPGAASDMSATSGSSQLLLDQLGSGAAVLVMGRQCRYRRNAEEGVQLVQ